MLKKSGLWAVVCILLCLAGQNSCACKDEAEVIHRLIDSGAPLTVESRLARGDRVRIRSGPLAGLEGTVLSRRGIRRLTVSVDFLQQGASVAVEDYMLETI